MKNLILFLLFIILVPVALFSLVAIYVIAKLTLIYVCQKICRVYRYAEGKFKDNETPSED